MSTFEHIIVESKGAVGIITLNRPKMLNALSFGVFGEIAAAVDELEANDEIGCILLAGGERAIAADTAKFGQPEITLGTIPGIGGTQRLTRAIGKSKAMDLCLTGRMMDAAEAERAGIVSRIVPAEKLMDEALAIAEKIASMSRPAAEMAKSAINRAFETPLSEGLNVERDLFHSTFALEDRSEGRAAFIEKRKPVNKNR